jgi:hypothetical protein
MTKTLPIEVLRAEFNITLPINTMIIETNIKAKELKIAVKLVNFNATVAIRKTKDDRVNTRPRYINTFPSCAFFMCMLLSYLYLNIISLKILIN